MSANESLGQRMKDYERVSRNYLPRRLPAIIRLDGRAFHTWTRGLTRPYNRPLMDAMDEVAKKLCDEVQNVAMAYVQSDEISLLLVDYRNIKTSSWFDSNVQKMVSVAAGIASSTMTLLSPKVFDGTMKPAVFDARAFVLPEHEVNNYFIWRQRDWNRNSLAMLAQTLCSTSELLGKDRAAQHELCFQKGVNWGNFDSHIKDGRVVVRKAALRQVRDIDCVKKWPECSAGEYDPQCCRFPKSCSVETAIVERSEWKVLEGTPNFSTNPEFVGGLLPPRS